MTSSTITNPSGERLDIAFDPGTRRDTLVILGHGLTGNKDRPLLCGLARGLSERGWPCMRVSFSGNGDSDGRFEDVSITKGIADLQAILSTVPDYVRVAYMGHSMGSAIGVMAAAKDLRINLLVSLAGMTRTAEFVKREFGDLVPGEALMWDEPDFPLSESFVTDLNAIDNVLPAAAAVTQPWLLIHGGADDLVPVQDGLDAHEAAVCRKQWLEIEGEGHMFETSGYLPLVDAVDDWLEMHFGGK